MSSELASYRPRIDGLRFVAISFVLLHHFGGTLATFFDGGYYGVDLFFVISGYLITTILLKDSHSSFGTVYRNFLGRRTLRIFPAYYLLLVLLLIIGVRPAREMFLPLATYTFNYAAALRQQSGLDNSLFYLWSLSVEEQFYLFWPPLVILLRRRPMTLLAITAAIVLIGYAQILFNLFPALVPFNYTGLVNRMGSLGLGSLGAVYASSRQLPSRIFKSAAVEVLAIFMLIAALSWAIPLRFVVLGIVSLFLVLKAAHFDFRIKPLDRFLTNRVVLYIGAISYGIYLFHVPIGLFLTPYVVDPIWGSIPFQNLGPFERLRWHSWLLKLPLYVAITVAAASISYRYFESPILRLKGRWFAYRSPASA